MRWVDVPCFDVQRDDGVPPNDLHNLGCESSQNPGISQRLKIINVEYLEVDEKVVGEEAEIIGQVDGESRGATKVLDALSVPAWKNSGYGLRQANA